MEYRKQMFQAVCDKCGKKCEVPFRPTGGKPVLCSVCFGHKGDRYQSKSGDRKMFQAVCDKCGKKCEVPFRPTAGKPIYCNECFGKNIGHKDMHYRDKHRGTGNDQVFQQLRSLSSKLDRVLNLLESGAGINKSSIKETASKKSAKSGSASGGKKLATEKKTATKAQKKPIKKATKNKR